MLKRINTDINKENSIHRNMVFLYLYSEKYEFTSFIDSVFDDTIPLLTKPTDFKTDLFTFRKMFLL